MNAAILAKLQDRVNDLRIRIICNKYFERSALLNGLLRLLGADR
jgi:hypothetical protein